ncbi:MAG: hypothetical protein ACKON9_12845, partial [Planctomycetaceae bacterium]
MSHASKHPSAAGRAPEKTADFTNSRATLRVSLVGKIAKSQQRRIAGITQEGLENAKTLLQH